MDIFDVCNILTSHKTKMCLLRISVAIGFKWNVLL